MARIFSAGSSDSYFATTSLKPKLSVRIPRLRGSLCLSLSGRAPGYKGSPAFLASASLPTCRSPTELVTSRGLSDLSESCADAGQTKSTDKTRDAIAYRNIQFSCSLNLRIFTMRADIHQ